MKHLPPDLREKQPLHLIPDSEECTKTLGIKWDTKEDVFYLSIAELPPLHNLTKRKLVSDIARTFDVLGWFSPTTIKMKILLQRLWELKVDWDDPLTPSIGEMWLQWRTELDALSRKPIKRCYFPKDTRIVTTELHGFCDASESAYAAVIYLRMIDTSGTVHISLVASKTKVAPIKRLTIPRLELCGAYLLTQLLLHIKQVFNIPLNRVYAWTDSTIVLNWLVGSPRRFKTFVGNRISSIVDSIPPDRWNHVNGLDNPADCASRGLLPSKLLKHGLWWNAPDWLKIPPYNWPKQSHLPPVESSDDEREVCLHTSHSAPLLLQIHTQTSAN